MKTQRQKGLGDVIADVATPVARALKLPCIDPATNELRPDSPCAKRKQVLNDLSDAIYDRFWNPEESKNMDYLVTKTTTEMLAVKAESAQEAENTARNGQGEQVSFSSTYQVRPRATSKPTTTPVAPA